MPRYTFELVNGSSPASDKTGISAPDRDHALAYGKEVACELMRGCEIQTRSWRLDVYEDGRERVAEIPFATVDPSLEHLAPELRRMIERVCDSFRSWQDAFRSAQVTMRESRALLALARGKPYLATVAGRPTIR